MSHEDIINHYRINAKIAKLEVQDFVRIEINPVDMTNITRNKKDWIYKIDRDGALPQWFLDNQEKAEKAAWLEWQKSIKINLAIGEEKIEAINRFMFACGKAKIIGHDSSHMEGYDSSHMIGYDSSHMIGYDSSHMIGHDSSHMEGYDSSHMEGYDSSHMIGHDSSHMEGYDSSHMIGYDSSHMIGYDSSHMIGYDSSHMEGHDSSHMEGYDSSHMEGYGSSHMEGYGSSCGHLYSGKFELKSKTAVIINHNTGKIIISKEAIVEVQEEVITEVPK